MKNEIYEYLINYGFGKEILDRFEKLNEDMYFVSLDKVKENINFFASKGLNNKEIIGLANINPFILTLSSKRKKAFDEIYVNKLNLSSDQIKYLLNNNSNIYTCSPLEFDKIIDYLNKHYSIDNIKQIILNNPNIINKKIDEIVVII